MKTTLLSLILLLLIPGVSLRAQTIEGCAKNRNAPPAGAFYWPPDTEVKVYFFRNMFTPAQKETLQDAMELWTKAAKNSGAGVSFVYAGETDEPVACRSCLMVTRREVFKNDHKHYAFFYPLQSSHDPRLVSAWIDLDVATISPQAIQGFMAHELGHGMGLGDCTSCKKKQTIMNGFPGVNKDNGLIEPSACDLEVVRQVYELQRRVAGNTHVETRVD
ncbi:MAG TPA: hypothetical protein DHU55_11835 [Blastocatellia bacterium]|jgi:hypothetical protein|nr:hypothetical protein [Blastocatellia bacterium]HAF23900.1 hypothetical protein [Blastocatellia bacterium]HCX30438.1 hypothetical protein [Blastocatellia bacterium]